MSRAIREVCVWAGGVLTFAALFFACWRAAHLFPSSDSEMPFVIVTIVVAIVGSISCFVFLRRLLHLPRASRLVIVFLATTYGVTWAFGVPQIHSDLTASEVGRYKRLKAKNYNVWESHPYIRFFVSLPVLPGIVLTYHEYQLAGLYGAGVWEVHAWYGIGTHQLLRVNTWMS